MTYVPQRHAQHQVLINVNGQPLTGSRDSTSVPGHLVLWFRGNWVKRQFDYPWEISISSTGIIAVADDHNNKMQVFTSDGEFLRESGQGRLNGLVSVAFTSADHVIVIDVSWCLQTVEVGVHLKFLLSVFVTSDGLVIVCDLKSKAGPKPPKLSQPQELRMSVKAAYLKYSSLTLWKTTTVLSKVVK